jgi:NAD-dependent dihydropyrimidine dehydrogenase PreA subunit
VFPFHLLDDAVTKVIALLMGTPYSAEEDGGGPMAYVIAGACVGVKDTACVDVCPADCIHPRKDEAEFGEVAQLYIDAESCICCAACVPACPVTAIYSEEELPEKMLQFTQANAEFYLQKKS